MIGKLVEQGAADGEHREIALTKEEFLIGRGTDCDLRLGSSSISRHHCMLRIRKGEATLVDLGSANGTFVNGNRVRSQATVGHGEEISLGEFKFLLELQGRSGIDWGPGASIDADNRTYRLTDMQRERAPSEPKKDESHPPGEAGG
jgi:pSer/pThr/pTyr-binding forkhead associated (FHA) protein